MLFMMKNISRGILMMGVLGTLVLVSWKVLEGYKPKIVPAGYTLAWNDEFNGKSLDISKWSYVLGKRRDAINVKETCFLDNRGYLHLRVNTSGDSIIAAMVSTQHLFETKYGYFECRAKLTNVMGIWPAFWLQSDKMGADNGTPEINGVELDIFEYFPNFKKDTVTHNIHWGGYGRTHQEVGLVPAALQKTPDDFHVFGLEWTDSSYSAFVDGVLTARSVNYISKIPEFIFLSLECSSVIAGTLNRSELPADFIVDYVRVYKKNILKL